VQWSSNRDIAIALGRTTADVENAAGNSRLAQEIVQHQNVHGHPAMRRWEGADQQKLQHAISYKLDLSPRSGARSLAGGTRVFCVPPE
jgi:hypothetical protein